MGMNLFAQITKVDVAKREVWGRATDETPDHAGEAFDYAKSKPHFEAWSKSFADATDGKSLGNIRSMHGKIAAGKVVHINYNDAEKAIDIGAKIVDDNEWQKVLEGVHTGFSIGGSYVGDKVAHKMADGSEVKRYEAKPNEISIVDAPCNPSAKFFDIIKADGVVEKVAFKTPDVTIAGSPEQVDELAKLMADGKLDMAAVIALVKAKPAPAEPHPLVKAAQEFVDAQEAGAKSFELTGTEFDTAIAKALTVEEIAAVTKDTAPSALMKALTASAVAKGMADHMQKMHDMLGELGAKCKADKAAPTGDLAKLAKDLADTQAQVKKLLDQPVPHVALRMVSKTGEPTDAPDLEKITFGDLKASQVLLKADGSIDYEMSVNVAKGTARLAHKESLSA